MARKSITLIGMSGVGKSTVGRQLAGALACRSIDGDDCIVAKTGRPLQEFLDAVGDEAFLKVERDIVCGLDLTTERCVFAPGGSIVYIPEVLEHIAPTFVVYLFASAEYIQKRTSPNGRGIVGLRTRTFDELWAERHALYERAADLCITVEQRSIDEIVTSLLCALPERVEVSQ